MRFIGRLMPANQLRTKTKLFAAVALSLSLASCGTNTSSIICNAPVSSGSSCGCGSGTAACPISPGPEFLYATSLGGQILAFSIDHSSGALTTIGSVPGPSMSLGITAVNNQFLFASDTHHAQLDGFSISQTTGALTALAGSPFATGVLSVPGDLVSPQGSSLLYDADAFTVDAFTISAAGAPTALSGSPALTETGFSLAVDPSGKFLYASDAVPPGGVLAFTIDSTGTPAAVPGSPFAIPGQTVPNSLPTAVLDTGSYVYTALSLTNQIGAFSIVSATGALTPVPGSPFSTGATPNTLVFAGGFLYALNHELNQGTITGYSVNSNNGVLTPLSDSPFAIVGFSMATDFFGQYLYVAGPTGIEAFSIDSTSGALTPLAGSPFPGSSGATLLTVVQIPPP
jgi:6-phosphogluconolactonase